MNTGIQTPIALITSVLIIKDFRDSLYGLGVSTPQAPEGTFFHEYSSPDTRAIVNAVTLDIKYQPSYSQINCFPFSEASEKAFTVST